jgi:hypothetical protein
VEADLFNVSKIGSELPSTDLDEGRHGRGVDSETVSDEVIAGSEFPQMQSDRWALGRSSRPDGSITPG